MKPTDETDGNLHAQIQWLGELLAEADGVDKMPDYEFRHAEDRLNALKAEAARRGKERALTQKKEWFETTEVASLILDYIEQNDMNMADLPAYPEWIDTEWLQCFKYARKFRLTFKGGQKFDVLITHTEPSRRKQELLDEMD